MKHIQPYIRLLRLTDHYPTICSALGAGIFLNIRTPTIVLWAVAATCISIGSFVVNELIDRNDVDHDSWNPIHIGTKMQINTTIAWCLSIFFTLFGILISWYISFFWMGLTMAIWYWLYSLPPFRFKAVFGLDILTQVGAGIAIPFGTVIWNYHRLPFDWMYIFIIGLTSWSIAYPYQLADYIADKKANLRNTHVVLGLQNTLYVNTLFAITGIFLYFVYGGLFQATWLLVLPFCAFLMLYKTKSWLQLSSEILQVQAFRSYVFWMKPMSQLILPYTIILWLLIPYNI